MVKPPSTTIILVPGLAGSCLSVRLPSGRNYRVFGAPLADLLGRLRPITRVTGGDLRVLIDAIRAVRNGKDEITAADAILDRPLYPGYGPMVATLTELARRQGWGYCAFPYNWTASIFNNGEQLGFFLNEHASQTGCSNYIIVAHSMGTLVTLATVQSFDPSSLPSIRGLVLFKGPLRGSVLAYKLITSGVTGTLLDWCKPRNDLQSLGALSDGIWQLLPRTAFLSERGSSYDLL